MLSSFFLRKEKRAFFWLDANKMGSFLVTMHIKKLVSVVSRTGRHLQRYNQGFRQVVGCIPYRIKKTSEWISIEDLEVLMISSQKSPVMMFPKGGWELDENIELAASRETLEEAGVIGRLEEKLGVWTYKSKSQEKFREGTMFPLLVTEELDVWPEKNARQRKWMTVNEAREACTQSWMKEALEKFVSRFTAPQKGVGQFLKPFGLAWCSAEDFGVGIGAQAADEDGDFIILAFRCIDPDHGLSKKKTCESCCRLVTSLERDMELT